MSNCRHVRATTLPSRHGPIQIVVIDLDSLGSLIARADVLVEHFLAHKESIATFTSSQRPRTLRTLRRTSFSYSSRFSRHILAASTFAGLSSLGSASMLMTLIKIFSTLWMGGPALGCFLISDSGRHPAHEGSIYTPDQMGKLQTRYQPESR
ncbi:hypothetical protein MRB53_041370 [Persea americana]|nr:hypothetical protein MRB53_041370 [Persea americana]